MIFKENLLQSDINVDFKSGAKVESLSLSSPLDVNTTGNRHAGSGQTFLPHVEESDIIDISDGSDLEIDVPDNIDWESSSDEEGYQNEEDNKKEMSSRLEGIFERIKHTSNLARSLDSSEWLKQCLQIVQSDSNPKLSTPTDAPNKFSPRTQDSPRLSLTGLNNGGLSNRSGSRLNKPHSYANMKYVGDNKMWSKKKSVSYQDHIDILGKSDSDDEVVNKVCWDVSTDDDGDDDEDNDEVDKPQHKGSLNVSQTRRSSDLKGILNKLKTSSQMQRAKSLDSSEWLKQCITTEHSNSSPKLSMAPKYLKNSSNRFGSTNSLNVSVPNLSDDSAIKSGSTSPETLSVSDRFTSTPKRVSLLSRRNQNQGSPIMKQTPPGFINKVSPVSEQVVSRHKLAPLPGVENVTNREEIERQLQSSNNNNLMKYTGDGKNVLNKYEFLYMGGEDETSSSSDEESSDESDSDGDEKINKSVKEQNLHITMHDTTKAMKSVPRNNDDLSEYFVSPDSNVLLEDELNTKMSRSHWVDFCDLRLLSIPPSVTSQTHIQALKLDGNWIQKLPEDIGVLDKLQCISIRANHLYNIPVNLEKCEHLQWLSLEDNTLTTLPQDLGCLQNLSYLNVKKNTLEKFPKVITTLQNLSVLDLSENSHLYLTEGYLKHMKNLTWLSLAATVTMSIPSDIDQCTKLQHLDVSQNFLRRLPRTFKALVNLKILHLEKNSFGMFPDVLYELTNLEILDISSNDLMSMSDSISKLSKLRSLNVENNSLRRLPQCLEKMSSITELKIAGNKIK